MGAVLPAHLQGGGDNNLYWFIWGHLGEDVAEIKLLFLRDTHAPKTILDIELHEDPRALFFRASSNGVYQSG